MSIQKLLKINNLQGILNPYKTNKYGSNFVKNTFNFGDVNLNRPNGIVYENALGDPVKGTKLYCLG